METDKINDLLEKYIAGRLTEEELNELYALLTLPENKMLMQTLVKHLTASAKHPLEIDDEATAAAFSNIIGIDKGLNGGRVKQMSTSRLIVRWSVAASVIFLMATGGYLWLQNRSKPPTTQVAKTQPDIPAGKTGAVLTLADGSKVVLDSLHNGVVAQQNGAQVMLKSGQLAYDAS
jgi:hypothetical protein